MSIVSQPRIHRVRDRLRRLALQGYYILRASLWRAIVMFGGVLILIGFALDVLDIHGTFAAIFGIWGISLILAGVFGFVVVTLVRRYIRLMADEV